MKASRTAFALAALMGVSLATRASLDAPRAVAAATTKPASAKAPAFVVPAIADDYTRAVAEARARKVPLFIEAWAPW